MEKYELQLRILLDGSLSFEAGRNYWSVKITHPNVSIPDPQKVVG